ncbi:uncharacterized protein LOC129225772 isoform X2 [Uloborus diversus]|uniref:uncharacterized protein LOC129225772 isoform X2 n=1 Tax=Uloborus diversus TaxID=327109 RepID=UPI00240A9073|nr:uncharacterized protein LOC129225772 isoform X2 [Uloborus diversus]
MPVSMLKMLLMSAVFLALLHYSRTDVANGFGPEERRTLLIDDDDDFTDFQPNTRQQDCARDFEDCSNRLCCNECTRCSCNRNGQHCRCSQRSDLAVFLGLCNG